MIFRSIGVALRFLPVLVLLVERIRAATRRESDGGQQVTPEEVAAIIDEGCTLLVEQIEDLSDRGVA